VEPIGVIQSELKKIENAPSFYAEGAPNVFLEIDPAYFDGLHRMQAR
jgi:tRNA (Thr-GGU) A37 N-methylase